MIDAREIANELNAMPVGLVYCLTPWVMQGMVGSLWRSGLEVMEECLIGFNVGCWRVWIDHETGNRHYTKVKGQW